MSSLRKNSTIDVTDRCSLLVGVPVPEHCGAGQNSCDPLRAANDAASRFVTALLASGTVTQDNSRKAEAVEVFGSEKELGIWCRKRTRTILAPYSTEGAGKAEKPENQAN